MRREPMFSEDIHLIELVNSAERRRRWYHRVDWFAVAAFAGIGAFLWIFWYGVATGF